MYSTNENPFTMEKALKKRKLNGITMFTIVFTLLVLIIGITAGITYSGFQSTAQSDGTLTFAVNGHQGTMNLSNTKVTNYNSQDLTLTFTLVSDTNYTTPTISGITMGGVALTESSGDFKTSTNVIVATYSAPTLMINRANVTGNLVITGSSTAQTYTITYNSNGGTGTMSSTTPSYDTIATLRLNTFTRPGYTFAGWATSDNGNVVLCDGSMVKDLGDITLYAKWVANVVTIDIKKDDFAWSGSGMSVWLSTDSTSSTIGKITGTASGSSVAFSQVTAGTTYYIWAGKNSDNKSTVVNAGSVMGAANTTQNATINYYTLTLNKGTGISAVSGNITYLSGQLPIINATLVTGYHWVNWTVGTSSTQYTAIQNYTFVSGIIATTTLKANGEINTYTITFKNYDNTTLQSSNWNYGATPSYSGTPTRAATAQYSYTFTGWSPSIVAVTGIATYTAQYSSSIRSYTVTFQDICPEPFNVATSTVSYTVQYGTTLCYQNAGPNMNTWIGTYLKYNNTSGEALGQFCVREGQDLYYNNNQVYTYTFGGSYTFTVYGNMTFVVY